MNTLVCPNALGSGAGVRATAGVAGLGLGVGPGARTVPETTGNCPEGGGRCAFGGRVGNGAAVGIDPIAGPGSPGLPGLTMCGVTTMISSLRSP